MPKKKKTIIELLSLKTHGENLLTPGAEWWIFAVRIIITIMAFSEALSWAYLGWSIAHSFPLVIRSISAIIAGGFILFVIWLVDASFMTLDLAKSFYERTINGVEKSGGDEVLEKAKTFSGILGRVGIVAISYTISAPFLAQMMFSSDIDAKINSRNSLEISKKRSEIISVYDQKISSLGDLIRKNEEDYVIETAGQGVSGIIGRGATAKAISENIIARKKDLANLVAEKNNEIASYDAMSVNEKALKYSLKLLQDGVETRGVIADEILKDERAALAKQVVRVFLVLLIGGMLLMKIFQPRSIKIYYNEQLQGLYDEYLQGRFDRWLAETEKRFSDPSKINANGGIPPLRFEDWCLNTYSEFVADDTKNRHIGLLEARYNDSLAKLEKKRDDICGLHVKYECRVGELKSSMANVEMLLNTTSAGLENARSELRGTIALNEKMKSALSRSSGRALAELHENITRNEDIVKRLNIEIATHEAQCDKLNKELADLQVHIASSGAAAGTTAGLQTEILGEIANNIRQYINDIKVTNDKCNYKLKE